VRLATFNVLHGLPLLDGMPQPQRDATGAVIGPPMHLDPQPLRDSAALLDADVLGLQEIDQHQERSGMVDQTAEVADALDAQHFRFAASVRGTPGHPDGWDPSDGGDNHDLEARYGVGLVSRWPVREWHEWRFPAARASLPLLVPAQPRPQWVRVADEPRAAIAAVIDGPQGTFTAVTVHLSFVPGTNIAQLRRLRALVADLPRPLFLLGDLNLPGRLPRWATGYRSLATGATYPSMAPRVQFDHVLADGLDPRVRTVATVHRLPVSDHCALSVDLV
jgi:endonuclease/exonuclease/phosphatase family metal-dependent hydrolase